MVMEKIPIYYVESLPGKFRGMCIPPLGIFILKKYKGNEKILHHDLIHWRQFRKMGFLDFYVSYIAQFIFYGYDKMPMEIEARQREKNYLKNNYRLYYWR